MFYVNEIVVPFVTFVRFTVSLHFFFSKLFLDIVFFNNNIMVCIAFY